MNNTALQSYVEQNLPDRFRSMKIFRIPVNCDGVNYWAAYNNGAWDFQPAQQQVQPMLIYRSSGNFDVDDDDGLLADIPEELQLPEKRKGRPVREAPIKKERPVKEKPVKEKPPKKEKPVKERPVKEKPVKERPVREKPPKKEKPVKERPIRQQRQEMAEADDMFTDIDTSVDELDMNAPFDPNNVPPSTAGTRAELSFVKDKQRKKLTGRIIFNIIVTILTLGSSVFITIPVIVNCVKANSRIGNAAEYWHYRSKSAYLHFWSVVTFIMAIVIIVLFITSFAMMMSLLESIFGGMSVTPTVQSGGITF